MITSLFSSFNPSIKLIKINRIIILTVYNYCTNKFLNKKITPNNIKNYYTKKKLIEEFINNTKHKELIIILIRMFTVIIIRYIIGLFRITNFKSPINFNINGTTDMTINITL